MTVNAGMRRYSLIEPQTDYVVKRLTPTLWRVRDAVTGEEYECPHDEFRQRFARRSLHEIALGPVESSNIAAVGYDPSTWDLLVQFQHGGLYHYEDVPPAVAGPMMGSAKGFSVGGYFASAIKARPDLYPYRRLDDPAPSAPAGLTFDPSTDPDVPPFPADQGAVIEQESLQDSVAHQQALQDAMAAEEFLGGRDD